MCCVRAETGSRAPPSVSQFLSGAWLSRLFADNAILATRGSEVTVVTKADLSGADIGDSNKLRIGSDVHVHEGDRTIRLGEALIEDLLSHPGPALVILDTYDQATPECAKWVLGSLLPVVAKHPRLFCVVGGRSVPSVDEHRLSWGEAVHIQTLANEISLDDWYEYACQLFPGFPRQDLATVPVA